jgi:hypothetical protein
MDRMEGAAFVDDRSINGSKMGGAASICDCKLMG